MIQSLTKELAKLGETRRIADSLFAFGLIGTRLIIIIAMNKPQANQELDRHQATPGKTCYQGSTFTE